MLDFETPTYITAKESQQMQSGVSASQNHHPAHVPADENRSTHKGIQTAVTPKLWRMGLFNM